MEAAPESPARKWLGRCVGIATVAAAAVLLVLVIEETGRHPRTDDANVRANFIEIVAEVSGRLVELPVKDNALVKKGDLLFAIDSRPYEYTLHQALSDQANLEQQIIDEGRKIAAQNSGSGPRNSGTIDDRHQNRRQQRGCHQSDRLPGAGRRDCGASATQPCYEQPQPHRTIT